MSRAFGTDQSSFIMTQLRSMGKKVKKRGREIHVQCLNPSHVDAHPSMSIRSDGAVFICRSCGYRGSWAKLVRQLGLPPLPGSDQPVDEITRAAADIRDRTAQDERAPTAALGRILNTHRLNTSTRPRLSPWTRGPFRGVSAATLARLDTRLWRDRGVDRIYWPFYMGKDDKGEPREVGGTGRVLPESEPKRLPDESDVDFKDRLKAWYRDGNPKYRNVVAAPVKTVLYPYDLFDHPRVIVLVEGPTSAIRLIDAGIAAWAILGVENWSDVKRELLVAKGVKAVILLFDGDDAGRRATKEIAADLETSVKVQALELPDRRDPGDMSDRWLALVRHEYQELVRAFEERVRMD